MSSRPNAWLWDHVYGSWWPLFRVIHFLFCVSIASSIWSKLESHTVNSVKRQKKTANRKITLHIGSDEVGIMEECQANTIKYSIPWRCHILFSVRCLSFSASSATKKKTKTKRIECWKKRETNQQETCLRKVAFYIDVFRQTSRLKKGRLICHTIRLHIFLCSSILKPLVFLLFSLVCAFVFFLSPVIQFLRFAFSSPHICFSVYQFCSLLC